MSIFIGDNTVRYAYVNILDGAYIGAKCNIGAYSEIGSDVHIGNRCKIQARVFIPKGVILGDDVFIGPGVTFTNDRYPNSKEYGKFEKTIVEDNVSIGAASTIRCGITIGEGARIGAGSVVTKDVKPGILVVGNPAREVISNE